MGSLVISPIHKLKMNNTKYRSKYIEYLNKGNENMKEIASIISGMYEYASILNINMEDYIEVADKLLSIYFKIDANKNNIYANKQMEKIINYGYDLLNICYATCENYEENMFCDKETLLLNFFDDDIDEIPDTPEEKEVYNVINNKAYNYFKYTDYEGSSVEVFDCNSILDFISDIFEEARFYSELNSDRE